MLAICLCYRQNYAAEIFFLYRYPDPDATWHRRGSPHWQAE